MYGRMYMYICGHMESTNNSQPLAIFQPISLFDQSKLVGHNYCTFAIKCKMTLVYINGQPNLYCTLICIHLPGPVVNGTLQISLMTLESSINFRDKVLLNKELLFITFLEHHTVNRGG